MVREMVSMSADEAYEWAQERREEAIRAYAAGHISQWIADEILGWAEESYADYLAAVALGLITPQQVDWKKEGQNER